MKNEFTSPLKGDSSGYKNDRREDKPDSYPEQLQGDTREGTFRMEGRGGKSRYTQRPNKRKRTHTIFQLWKWLASSPFPKASP